MKLKKLKVVSWIVLVTFSIFSFRLDLLAAPNSKSNAQVTQKKPTTASQFQQLLKDTEKLLEEMETDLESGKDISSKLNQLKENKANLNNLAGKLRAEFNQTRAKLKSKEKKEFPNGCFR